MKEKMKFKKFKYGDWSIVVLISILLVLIRMIAMPSSRIKEDQSPLTGIDTFIPANMALVPIEIKNRSALDPILGATGVVDLFHIKEGDKKALPIIEGVKILRAPLDPSQFAVLVPLSKAKYIASFVAPLIVHVRNPNEVKNFVVKKKSRPIQKIISEELENDNSVH